MQNGAISFATFAILLKNFRLFRSYTYHIFMNCTLGTVVHDILSAIP